jgi:hypothetical protein
LATFRAEIMAFERRYFEIVGVRYAELDEIEAQIAEQLASRDEDDRAAQDDATRARAQANESRAAVDDSISKAAPKELPSQELKNLYREVAKQIHPDLSSDPHERNARHRFMAEANRAYEMGDINRLRQILEEYGSSPETVQGMGVGADLVKVIRKIAQIKKRLEEIDSELASLSESEIAKLKAKAQEYDQQGRDLLAEMAQQLDARIAVARQKIRH